MKMKKTVSIILVVVILLFTVSCGQSDRRYNAEEVKIAARTLIRKSSVLNDIFWGNGIPYLEDISYSVGNFYAADPVFIRDLGVETTEDIIELASKVFSDAQVQFIKNSVFSPKVGNSGMDGYSR